MDREQIGAAAGLVGGGSVIRRGPPAVVFDTEGEGMEQVLLSNESILVQARNAVGTRRERALAVLNGGIAKEESPDRVPLSEAALVRARGTVGPSAERGSAGNNRAAALAAPSTRVGEIQRQLDDPTIDGRLRWSLQSELRDLEGQGPTITLEEALAELETTTCPRRRYQLAGIVKAAAN